jgi:hypothetical protein
MKRCFSCKKILKRAENVVGRRECCPFCGADLHVCLNCLHYDPAACNQCRETQAERVLDKNRSNFCEYFVLRDADAPEAPPVRKLSAKEQLEALFKK